MQRREVLAAITAAIATPALAWVDDVGGATDGSRDRALGLARAQVAVREALADRVQDGLRDLCGEPGHSALIDMWLLDAAFAHNREVAAVMPCGLINALLAVLGKDHRFVAVPEELHQRVAHFAEILKNEEGPRTAFVVCPLELGDEVNDYIKARQAEDGSQWRAARL